MFVLFCGCTREVPRPWLGLEISDLETAELGELEKLRLSFPDNLSGVFVKKVCLLFNHVFKECFKEFKEPKLRMYLILCFRRFMRGLFFFANLCFLLALTFSKCLSWWNVQFIIFVVTKALMVPCFVLSIVLHAVLCLTQIYLVQSVHLWLYPWMLHALHDS